MRRQTIIALGVALVLGLLAVYLANVFLSRNQERAELAAQGTSKVAVAAIPLEYGVALTPEKIRFVDYPTASIPPGAFRTAQDLMPPGQQRVALRPIEVNEPILASKVTGPGQGASLAAILPDGMRAAAVRINDVSGVAGFVQPSDAVDVLVTRQIPGDNARQVTDVLLQNVRVIAIDQNAKDANGQPMLAKTATLEVTPTDAQKLALAQQVGQLSLVLRKPGEEQNNPLVDTVSLNDLRYSMSAGSRYTAGTPDRPTVTRVASPRRQVRRPAPAPRRAAPPQPQTNNVQVVRGTEGSNYEVGDYGS